MYKNALVRRPGRNFSGGITTSGLGKPDYEKALEQHRHYCDALIKCGVDVIVLEADERFPDGCFVEDTAIITNEVAVITNPGAGSRKGEEKEISDFFSSFKKVEAIRHPGTMDGGDILRADDHFYIGISKRTNREGAGQLAEILSGYGYSASEIRVQSVPHLKSGVTYLGNGTFISISDFSKEFAGSKVIPVDADESYSSNCLSVNGHLLISKGFLRSRQKILDLGLSIIEIEMSEFRKMDGALTCLSLLY